MKASCCKFLNTEKNYDWYNGTARTHPVAHGRTIRHSRVLRYTPLERIPPKGTTTVLGIKAKHATLRPGPIRYTTRTATTQHRAGSAKKNRERPAKTPKALGDMDTEGHASKNIDHAEARYKVSTAVSIREEIERGDGGTNDEVTARRIGGSQGEGLAKSEEVPGVEQESI